MVRKIRKTKSRIQHEVITNEDSKIIKTEAKTLRWRSLINDENDIKLSTFIETDSDGNTWIPLEAMLDAEYVKKKVK